MVDDTCAMVRRYLMQAVREHAQAQPTPKLCAHIAGCTNCRGALALLLADATGGIPAQPISCDACQRDLAAFIDIELLVGYREAQEHYPGVWWHLWTCADCAETYELIHELMRGDAPVLAANDAQRLVRLRQLGHTDLDDVLGPSPLALPVRRGIVSALTYLIEQEQAENGALLSVAVQRQASGTWLIEVTVQPTPAGTLVVILGDQRFLAPFDAQGRAVVRDIPFGLLVGDGGQDLDLFLEQGD